VLVPVHLGEHRPRGRALRTLGMDPCQLLLGCRRWPERSQTPQAGARARSALASSLREVLAGPGRCGTVPAGWKDLEHGLSDRLFGPRS
jgi:hypothetical protein